MQLPQTKHLAPDKIVRLYCWRGGMRSESMAWVLERAGFNVTLLTGRVDSLEEGN